MSQDARFLLRAAANERARATATGISDPFASYSATGGLRCSACNYLAIKHESLWGAHAQSKSHRNNAMRIREEEVRKAEVQRTKDGKRKADDSYEDLGEADEARASSLNANGVDDSSAPESKKARTVASPIDAEWELFKSQMDATESGKDPRNEEFTGAAALEAEAQLISHEEGVGQNAAAEVEEKSAEEIRAEERARKEQEEREEILSRLEEEQRQQDEADQR